MPAETPGPDTIFCAAIEIASAGERAAYIARACHGDEELQALVRKLVDAHFRAGSFLESPADVGATVDSRPPAEEGIAGRWHAEPPAAPTPGESVGTVIGPYKLVQEIGEGGMGTVFLAQQTEPVKRLVALKVIKPGMDSRQVVARFEAERQALALMDHPNIAKVLDGGTTAAGRPYFVMELVKGVPVTRYCDEHRLTPRQRLELMVPVCQAVQHAHQKGVIHRDLKPSNVLVASYDGRPVPKVIDFGVAKAAGQHLTERTLVTGFGAVVGTLEYMSPEQAEFNQLDVDTRSDVYSLGVLLYELLTGTTPLERKRLQQAAMLEVLRLIREEEPPRPSTRLSTVEGLPGIAANRGLEPRRLSGVIRGELDWIVMKALEKDRARRYETANGLALDLQRYLADEPVQACPPSAGYRLRKFARRNKTALATALVVTTALVAGTWVSVWQAIRASTASASLEKRNDELTAALDEAERERRAALDREYESLLAQLRALPTSGLPGQRFEGLRIVRRALRPELSAGRPRLDLRNAAAACLCLPDVEVAREWGAPWGGGIFDFDPRWTRYASSDEDGTVKIRSLVDGKVLMSLPSLGRLWSYGGLQFSPDGCCLGRRTEAGTFHYWRLDGPEPVELFRERKPVQAFAIRADSQQVALRMQDGGVSLRAAADGREEKVLSAPGTGWVVRFHPRRLDWLLIGDHGKVLLLDVNTGARLMQVVTGYDTHNLDWHPHEDRFVGSWGGEARVYDAPSGRLALPPFKGIGAGGVVRFNHAGDLVAGTDWDSALSVWDARSGHLLLQSHRYMIQTNLAFSPDDSQLAGEATLGTVRLLRLDAGRECSRIAAQHSWRMFAVTGDGRLAVVHTPHSALLLDLDYRTSVGVLPERCGSVQPLRFLPDGSLLSAGTGGIMTWSVEPTEGGFRVRQRTRGYGLGTGGKCGSSADGKVVAIPARWGGAQIAHLGPSRRLVTAAPQRDVRNCDVSPDGTLVVAGSHGEGTVTVWDAGQGARVKDLVGTGGAGYFSPDGRWLVVQYRGETWEGWRVGDWQRQWSRKDRMISDPVFSRDGRLMALTRARDVGYVHLLRPETGEEVVRLFAPERKPLFPLGFTPDGGRLIGRAENGLAYVWDLALIRRQLRDLGLDWDDEPLPPRRPAPRQPLNVEVSFDPPPLADLVDFVQEIESLTKKGDKNGALATCRKGLELYPKASALHCSLGELLEPTDRAGAVAAFRKATELDPDNVMALLRLGWALSWPPSAPRADLEEALAAFSRAVELMTGTDYRALSSRAALYLRLGRPEPAAADYSRALELSPRNGSLLFARAGAYARMGRWDEVVADYRELTKLSPGSYSYHLCLADALSAAGEKDEAVAAYHKAIALLPTDPRTYTQLGLALLGLKGDRAEDRIAAARKAVELCPEAAAPHVALGQSLEATDRAGALAAFRKAAELGPDDAVTHFLLGMLLVRPAQPSREELGEARAAFSRVIALQPNNFSAWANRGNVRRLLGQREEALADYDKALELARDLPQALCGKAEVHAGAGEWDKAIAAYSRCLKADPRHIGALYRRGQAHRELGKWQQAVADGEEAIRLAARPAPYQNDLAWLLATCPEAKARDPRRAVTLAQSAVKGDPETGTFWNTLGVAQYRAGDFNAAVESLTRSAELRRGGDAFDWFFLAMSHQKLGHADEAKKWYDRAIDWVEKNRPELAKGRPREDELRRFRREAEEAIGKNSK